mgnify:CR=1 FL=1
MIVVVVVMIFGVLKWLDIHTHHGETVAVPDVKGMTVDEAAKMFRNHGLVYVISDTKYVKDKAAGIILELKPGAGEKVKERTYGISDCQYVGCPFACYSRCGGQQLAPPGTGQVTECRF